MPEIFSPVEGHDNMIKNNYNGMILFADNSERISELKKNKRKEKALETRISTLESKMDLILELLQKQK